MTSWVRDLGASGTVPPRLFCFPFAGGNALVFRGWAESLASYAEVIPVELPGHGTRMREIPHRRMEALVDAVSAEILPLVDRPFAFFGHSMGGLLSYELTRRLQHLRRPLPLCLILSASLPPNRWENAVPRHTLSDQELIAELSRMNGTPRAILHNAELMDLLLPLLRADFELCETYRPSSPSPLNIPTTLVVGREDSHVTKEDLVGWDACICAPRELVIIPGDHFFIHTARHELLERITSVLASVTRSTREEKNR